MTVIAARSFCFSQFAVEGLPSFGAKGIAPNVGQQEPDTDWQPI